MPKIIKTMNQNHALEKIKANLKTITSINLFLALKCKSGFVSYVFDGRILKMPIEKTDADQIISSIRKDLVSETLRLSKNNSIELDEKDKEILNRSDSAVYSDNNKAHEEI